MSSYRAAAGSALQSRVVQLCVIALIALDLGVATVALLGTAAATAELPSAVVLAARWAPLALRVLLGVFTVELGALLLAFGSDVLLTLSYTADFVIVAVCAYAQYQADLGTGATTGEYA